MIQHRLQYHYKIVVPVAAIVPECATIVPICRYVPAENTGTKVATGTTTPHTATTGCYRICQAISQELRRATCTIEGPLLVYFYDAYILAARQLQSLFSGQPPIATKTDDAEASGTHNGQMPLALVPTIGFRSPVYLLGSNSSMTVARLIWDNWIPFIRSTRDNWTPLERAQKEHDQFRTTGSRSKASSGQPGPVQRKAGTR